MSGGGDIPTPTPIVAHGLVFMTSAHGPSRPVYAISLTAEGDISLADSERTNKHIPWSQPKRGAYMPTPIVYGEHLYVGDDRGILSCYEARTGDKVYRQRVGERGGAYTASPVAADGRLYFTNEEGQVTVIAAGKKATVLATNLLGEVCLATPAISESMIFFRTPKHVLGIGSPGR